MEAVQDNVHQACADGTYGKDCSSRCGHCRDGVGCAKVFGNCPARGCERGYNGAQCDTMCTSKTFGYNCEGHCHCNNISEQCNVVNGHCSSGCANGWTSGNCSTTCTDGAYGLHCSSKCSHCRDSGVCEKVTGNCPAGGCERGFKGAKCDTICIDKTFGYNCEGLCHCHNTSEQCNVTNGGCRSGCAIGWGGSNCSKGVGVGQSCNLTVYANNISITEEANLKDWTNIGDIMQSDNVNGVVLDLQSPRILRYVAFTTKYGTTMAICEVKLYAKDQEQIQDAETDATLKIIAAVSSTFAIISFTVIIVGVIIYLRRRKSRQRENNRTNDSNPYTATGRSSTSGDYDTLDINEQIPDTDGGGYVNMEMTGGL
ncbi:multiple epidermal growth factor-like domains protein 11 [Mya arenaria]|uniref:multiple epidermal growth factor-like domains protein 11 n=1 Tax=Mya arenaria TaxID=6604 RepID=UPI0022E46A93|nr:multiple epidermal growth factor-like domains protein 11 [Mya arenaria]